MQRNSAFAATLALSLLSLCSCFGQTSHQSAIQTNHHQITPTTGPVTFPSGNYQVVSSSTGSWTNDTGTILTTSYATPGGSWVVCDNNHCITTNNQEAEMRPFDSHGPTLAQVDLSAVPLGHHDVAPDNYLALAKEINLESPATDEAQLLTSIFDHEFHVYNFDKVDNYLYRQSLKQGNHMRWGWKPMRAADLKEVSESQNSNGSINAASGVVFQKLYTRKLPARILEDVKCVMGEVPNAVFLVSDFESVTPDPFLAVTTKQLLKEGKLWIVDRWDEPTFDDGKPVKAKLETRSQQ